eukprot:TRINITY_DN10484_c0_g1_i1.p1 TRINITY_DN10484_c0_g1~~TRINITY_DN10484_c0_g1_i1.p1  ORF type:complete len:578 (+),score=72.05 TRINITY_DN10484_c0_g1_i1:44-1735(+)
MATEMVLPAEGNGTSQSSIDPTPVVESYEIDSLAHIGTPLQGSGARALLHHPRPPQRTLATLPKVSFLGATPVLFSESASSSGPPAFRRPNSARVPPPEQRSRFARRPMSAGRISVGQAPPPEEPKRKQRSALRLAQLSAPTVSSARKTVFFRPCNYVRIPAAFDPSLTTLKELHSPRRDRFIPRAIQTDHSGSTVSPPPSPRPRPEIAWDQVEQHQLDVQRAEQAATAALLSVYRMQQASNRTMYQMECDRLLTVPKQSFLRALSPVPGQYRLEILSLCSHSVVDARPFLCLIRINSGLHSIFMSGNGLSDEATSLICGALQQHPAVHTLDLSDNKYITNVGGFAIRRLLEANRRVVSVYVKGTSMDKDVVDHLHGLGIQNFLLRTVGLAEYWGLLQVFEVANRNGTGQVTSKALHAAASSHISPRDANDLNLFSDLLWFRVEQVRAGVPPDALLSLRDIIQHSCPTASSTEAALQLESLEENERQRGDDVVPKWQQLFRSLANCQLRHDERVSLESLCEGLSSERGAFDALLVSYGLNKEAPVTEAEFVMLMDRLPLANLI